MGQAQAQIFVEAMVSAPTVFAIVFLAIREPTAATTRNSNWWHSSLSSSLAVILELAVSTWVIQGRALVRFFSLGVPVRSSAYLAFSGLLHFAALLPVVPYVAERMQLLSVAVVWEG